MFDFGMLLFVMFDNFIMNEENDEFVLCLQKFDFVFVAGFVLDWLFYIWGEFGSGCIYLLQVFVSDVLYGYVCYLMLQSLFGVFMFDLCIGIYVIDDCDWMSDMQQVVLFNLFNEVCVYLLSVFVVVGLVVLFVFDVCEDLCMWFGWGFVFYLLLLFDVGKIVVFKFVVKECGIVLIDDIVVYLLIYFCCDMLSLMVLFDVFDCFLFEQKCVVMLLLLCWMFVCFGDDIILLGMGLNCFE